MVFAFLSGSLALYSRDTGGGGGKARGRGCDAWSEVLCGRCDFSKDVSYEMMK